MQIATFMNGGFVAHKVRLASNSSVYSVWFNGQGQVAAIARSDKLGRVYDVSPTSPLGALVTSSTRYLVTLERCPLMGRKVPA